MYSRWKLLWVVALVTVLGTVGAASALAQTVPGAGPYAPAPNETGLTTLNPGQQHWYRLLSGVADPSAGDRQITIMMVSDPQGTATFDIWTPTGLERAGAGYTDINAKPIGSGNLHPQRDGDTIHDRYGGILEWTGQSGRPQPYIIQVKSKDAAPIRYNLMVNGKYVQFPDGPLSAQASSQGQPVAAANGQAGAAAPAAQTAVPATKAAVSQQPTAAPPAAQAVPAAPAAPAVAPVGGSGPETALPLDDATHPINPGQSQWYVINYPGEQSNGLVLDGTVALIAEPRGTVGFNVWTGDRLRARALGEKAGVPVGSATLHPYTRDGVQLDRYNGTPTWTNKSNKPAQFYIEVQATGNAPSSYRLEYRLE